jgi:homoserine O-acetyltransferase
MEANKEVSYADIESRSGHDDFLMPIPEYHEVLKAYLDRIALEIA